MLNVVAKLNAARKLIERGWTQKEYARGKCSPLSPLSKYAVCYCAAGAVGAVNKSYPYSDLPGMRALARAIGGKDEADVLNWNDAPVRTQAEVIEAFRKAAALARGQVQS